MTKRIFVAGATGFIGAHLVQALVRRGCRVTCVVRRPEPQLAQVADVIVAAPHTWHTFVANHTAVVNCAGIIRERHQGEFARIHTHVPQQLWDAAAQANIQSVVQLSAVGAAEDATTDFWRTKGLADSYLACLPLNWTVLRPSFVYGPGDHSIRLFEQLACLPLVPLPGGGTMLVQPLHVRDLVQAIVQAIDHAACSVVECGGTEQLTFATMVRMLGQLRGCQRPTINIPWSLIQAAAHMTDICQRGPITSAELIMLQRGTQVDLGRFSEHFGWQPQGFTSGIKARAHVPWPLPGWVV